MNIGSQNKKEAASSVFQSEPYTHVMSRLEIEIESGRLAIRCDRSPHSDVGAREALLQMLLSYNPIWLKLGLETIFGEEIVVINNQQSLSQVLSLYIQSRLLNNHQIADQYYQPTVLGHYGQGFNEALCQFILKKFLLLILLLDKAKLTRLIDHNPCLFVKDAQIKSSREMLLSFSRNFLSGEGDLTRHLQHLGYSVSHVQSSLDEFDYTVTNLATDLQDGLRLTRLAEILTGEWKFSELLRTPATTKMQKLHNVEIALKSFSNYLNIPAGTTTQSIVEGHREKTLTLLWAIIFHFKLPLLGSVPLMVHFKDMSNTLPDEKVVIAFVSYLCHRLLLLRKETRSAVILQRAWRRIQSKRKEMLHLARANKRLTATIKIQSTYKAFRQRKQYLIILKSVRTIQSYIRATLTAKQQRVAYLKLRASVIVLQSYMRRWQKYWRATLLANRQRKAYMELKQTVVVLQSHYRRYQVQKMLAKQNRAATILQSHKYWRATLLANRQRKTYMELKQAAVVLQSHYRRYQKVAVQREITRQHQAATIIQSWIRRYNQRKQYLTLKHSVIVLQMYWRATLACKKERMTYCRMKEAASCTITLQKYWRATLLANRQRKTYMELKQAAVVLQSHYRRYQVQQYIAIQHSAAMTIQANVRGYLVRTSYLALKKIVQTLQTYWKAMLLARRQRKRYLEMKQAAIVIQSHFRRWQVEQQVKLQHTAAIVLQSHYRAYVTRKYFLVLKTATILIQTYWRATLVARTQHQKYLEMKYAARVIQTSYRHYRKYKAAICIQAYVKAFLTRQQYMRLKNAAIIIQARWRAQLAMRQTRTEYLMIYDCIVFLQACTRRQLALKRYQALRQASITLQAHTRGYLTQKVYKSQKQAAIKIQSCLRGYWTQRNYQQMRKAAIT
ncbi:abnormal spindle-like microcephaly-associated protein homolog, partial [Gigantopelta aegis]|uniref:abnormal spindle-like microcephaly-associated protein homolog n=1 Tax=Gigantopelta aegis TaxID=1735272 RepID=UPI001B88C795